MFNYVLRLVGDRSLAEDLTQDIFLRVYQGLPGFSLRCRFTTWLFQVAKNRLKRMQYRPTLAYGFLATSGLAPP